MAAEAALQCSFSPLPAKEGIFERPGPPVLNAQSGAGSLGRLDRWNDHFWRSLAGVTNLKAAPEVDKTKLL